MSVEFGASIPSNATVTGVAQGAAKPKDTQASLEDVASASSAPQPDGPSPTLLQRLADLGAHVDARLSISQDDVTGSYVYRILDGRTGELVRQFPQEELLKLMRYLGEQHPGLVVDRTA